MKRDEKQIYFVTLVFPRATREIAIRATSRQFAEHIALTTNPHALRVRPREGRS